MTQHSTEPVFPDFSGREFDQEVRKIGQKIFDEISGDSPSVFRKDYWSGRVMDWSMRDEELSTFCD